MSQTRKPRMAPAEPRRRHMRDASLGTLTMAALWSLAGQTDRSTPSQGPDERQQTVQSVRPVSEGPAPQPGIDSRSVADGREMAVALAEATALQGAIRQLVASLTKDVEQRPLPSRAPAPDEHTEVSSNPGAGASAQGTHLRAQEDNAAQAGDDPAYPSFLAAAPLVEAATPPGATAAEGVTESGTGQAASGPGTIVTEAASPAPAWGGASTTTLIGVAAGVSAFAGLAGQGLTGAAPTASTPPPPPPPAPAPPAPAQVQFDARVVDGYVKGATVFYDADADGVLDAGEVSTVTDDDGNFSLPRVTPSANGRIVVLEGGTDIETGNPVGRLMASGDPTLKVVSPLTLVLALNPTLTEAELKTALGLPQSLDLETFDPVAAMDKGSAAEAALGQAVFAVQQQLLAVVQAVAMAVGEGQADSAALTKAAGAIGAALKDAAATLVASAPTALAGRLGDIVDNALETALDDANMPAAELEALGDIIVTSTTKVAEAYGTSDGGMSLWEARRVAATPDAANNADLQAAIEKLAGAKAAASASQTLLMDVVADVASGERDAQQASAAFSADLEARVEEQTSEYTDRITIDAGKAVTVDGLPAFLVADLTGANAGQSKAVLDYAAAVQSVTLADLVANKVRVVQLVGGTKALSLDLGNLQAFAGQELSAELFADGEIPAGQSVAGPDYVVTLRVANATELEAIVAKAQALVDAGIDELSITDAGLKPTATQSSDLAEAGLQVQGASATSTLRVTFEVDDTSGYTLGNPTGQKDYDFGGAGSSIAANPPSGASGRVAQVVKSDGAQVWAGTTFLTLATGELVTAEKPLITMRVWSPEAGTKVLLKLETLDNPPEGGTKFAEVEAFTTSAQAWQTLSFNFSSANHALSLAKASVFFDFGKAGTGKTFYFDSVGFLKESSGTPAPPPPPAPAPSPAPTAVSVTFDSGDSSGYALGPFGNAQASVKSSAPTGGSGPAVEFVKPQGAQIWAGVTFLNLPYGELITPNAQTATMRVWAPEAGKTVLLKLETATNPPNGGDFAQVAKTTTTAGWQTLTFDFGSTNPNHNLTLSKASVFFDFNATASGQTYWFDDVKFLAAVVDTTPPVFTGGASTAKAAAENQATLYTAAATDASGAVTYTLGGADAALLSISSAGVVTLKAGVLDFDAAGAKKTYHFEVVARDTANNSATQTVVVNVTNVLSDDSVTRTTVSLDALNPSGTQQTPATYDASQGAFIFTDDITRTNVTEITGFGSDDALEYLGLAGVEDLSIGNDGPDVSLTVNIEGTLSTVILKGAAAELVADDPGAIVYDVESFNALPAGDLVNIFQV